MKAGKNKKIDQATESLEEILKRIGPFMPKPPKPEPREQHHWRLAKSGTGLPATRSPKHNHVTSPF